MTNKNANKPLLIVSLVSVSVLLLAVLYFVFLFSHKRSKVPMVFRNPPSSRYFELQLPDNMRLSIGNEGYLNANASSLTITEFLRKKYPDARLRWFSMHIDVSTGAEDSQYEYLATNKSPDLTDEDREDGNLYLSIDLHIQGADIQKIGCRTVAYSPDEGADSSLQNFGTWKVDNLVAIEKALAIHPDAGDSITVEVRSGWAGATQMAFWEVGVIDYKESASDFVQTQLVIDPQSGEILHQDISDMTVETLSK